MGLGSFAGFEIKKKKKKPSVCEEKFVFEKSKTQSRNFSNVTFALLLTE